jgi:hypothetical protein
MINQDFLNGFISGMSLRGLPIYVTMQNNIVLFYNAADTIIPKRLNHFLSDGEWENFPDIDNESGNDTIQILDSSMLADGATVSFI